MPKHSATLHHSTLRAIRELDAELLERFGPQGWWPTTPRGGVHPRYRPGREGRRVTDAEVFEIICGAILTQNTAWRNVEKALVNLNAASRLELGAIAGARRSWLESAVRPSGYYRQKAEKLKRTARAILAVGGVKSLRAMATPELRELLLSWHGFGPETADSALCYAFARPVFVVDAYTKRLFKERGIGLEKYDEIQRAVHEAIEPSAARYGDFHARIVVHMKS